MIRPSYLVAVVVAAGLCALGLTAQEPADSPEIVATPALVTSPMPFIGITPCRIADTRDASFPPGYGPPSLSPGVANGRTFVMTGQCGIPDGVVAVSLNVTAVNPQGVGYLVLYPQDGAFPSVSTLNYAPGQTVANAAVVPLGTNGSIRVVAGVSGTDLILDTNGYYAGSGTGGANVLLGLGAGNATMTGFGNTAMGDHTLTAMTTGVGNTAIGSQTLYQATTSSYNTGAGVGALYSATTGFENSAFGAGALGNNVTGSNNIAIGWNAGSQLTGGDGNIYIGSPGGASNEGATIRIGFVQNRAFIEGIRGRTTGQNDAIPVLIDSLGQLGTLSSSARFKEDVQDMGDASSALLKLRPVTFRYKEQAGRRRQFGLIAEEVEDVIPDLVVRDSTGAVESVLYHEMPAMLLNELQKQEGQIEELLRRIDTLEREKR